MVRIVPLSICTANDKSKAKGARNAHTVRGMSEV